MLSGGCRSTRTARSAGSASSSRCRAVPARTGWRWMPKATSQFAMSDASKIVAAFQQAMGRCDFIAARKLLRDDLSFRGPIGTFDSAEALMEALKRLQSFVERADVRKLFA